MLSRCAAGSRSHAWDDEILHAPGWVSYSSIVLSWDASSLICPNVPGHLNPMLALADAIRRRGHRATFFLLGDVPEFVGAAGIEVVPLGGSIFPPDEYRTAMQRLGT